jgi:hypothetical protein
LIPNHSQLQIFNFPLSFPILVYNKSTYFCPNKEILTMRKTLTFIILLPIILTACNLPGMEQVPADDSIATKVSASLTAETGAEIDPVATSVSSTLVAKTSEAATDDPSVDRPVEVQPTSELEAPTETVTPTLVETATPTPSITPTLELGNPTLRNQMDSNVPFGLQSPYEDTNSYFAISNGVMIMKSFNTAGYRGWRLTSQVPGNIYLQAIYNVQACSGQDQYGLILRAPDYGSGYGYYLGITCDGQYRFTRWDSNGVNSLASGSDPAILGGAGQTNRLAIRAEGSTFKIYVNDKMIKEVSDSGISGSGHYGVFVAGTSGSLIVDTDEIAYWKLP